MSGKENVPQSWNRYVYTLNNPLNYVDPDGLEWRRHDETGGIKWYKENDDRAGTTEWTQLVYPHPTNADRIVILNPEGPQGWKVTVDFDLLDFAWSAGITLNVNGPYEAVGWTTAPQPGSGAVEEVPEHIIGAVGLGQVGVGLGRAALGETVLYRGVPKGHEFFDDALNGTARPFGGHSNIELHNRMNTHSEFTSWTTDQGIASGFAGRGGVVLEKTFSRSQVIRSPDVFNEGERLIRGTVTGAKVTKQ